MIVAPDFHGVAIAISQHLLFSAIGGTLLAASVWFLLQLFPKRDSGTNFAVWFSTLLATALLPILSFHSLGKAGASQGPHAVFTVSSSVAWNLFLGWAIIAMVGLVRIVVATRQVRRLRRDSVPVDMESLHVDLRALIEEARKSRPVVVLASERLEVPTAIGFRNAAVILPAWMLENTPAEELKYILLHELAHLRRRDDWTNLAQKLLKALLFFLPSVWWIERRLSLDREMACDDAVLAHSGTPRGYAECLARVAERSFLRRQIALAQAAVGRVRPLTARVTKILDPDRPRATQSWKPAVPVIIVLAGLCALPASFTPELVRFADDAPAAQAQSAQANRAVKKESVQAEAGYSTPGAPRFRAVAASLRTDGGYAAPVNKRTSPGLRGDAGHFGRPKTCKRSLPAVMTAKNQPPIQEQYVTVREEVFFVVTQRTASGEQQSWQMHMVQVSVQPQGKTPQKPRKI
jgi:beta-lactamase regulating signal transducer with metallopeptidase domain